MQITDHVHALRMTFSIPVAPGQTVERFVYCWLVAGERPWLVDAGVAAAAEEILAFIEQAGADPAELDALVLTHPHPDHIGGARAIREATGCRIAAHEAAVAWIEDTNLQERERPVPGFEALVAGSVPVDLRLEGGEVLDLGAGVIAEVVHVPGHSRGQIALLVQPDGALICADALPAPGTPPIYEDVPQSVASIERLMALGDVEVLLSSWDEPHAGAKARRQMRAALEFIQRVGAVTHRVAAAMPEATAAGIAPQVLEELGVRLPVVPPMVVQSISAHLARRR